MFSPLICMILILAAVFFIGLFYDYGKQKGWDKPQPSDKK